MGVAGEPFGQRLRRLRERSGLTQEQLAERARLSVNAISSLERGERSHPYPHTVHALAEALGLGADELEALVGAIARNEQRPKLPVVSSTLIGREGELRTVADLLLSSPSRIVTITGPGGVGKTRLALAAAEGLAGHFRDGIAFVSLAPVRDPSHVLMTAARCLSLRESGSQELPEVLRRYLQRRIVLLVLDNFEHLAPAASDVSDLLSVAAQLRILVTSRSPLGLQSEQVYPLLPLALQPAMQLFEERAARFRWDVTADQQIQVAEICRRLDCLPLAVELAAAKTRMLSPSELLSHLDQALALLTGGAKDVPKRQQTLRETIGWSYDLLSEDERVMFRRLAVFTSGWTLQAAAAIGQLGDTAALDLLTGLVDNSLVTRLAGSPNETRFGLLDTIRSYAAERLQASGETAAIHDLHAGYFHTLASNAGVGLFGPSQAEWLERLQLEHENFRVALRWMLHNGDLEHVSAVCFGLWHYWSIRGHYEEGELWVDEALRQHGSLSESGRARLLFSSGAMLYPRGRHDEAAERLDMAAELARQVADRWALGQILVMRGYVAVFQGRPDLAAACFDEAETLYRLLGGRDLPGLVSVGRAHVAESQHGPAAADQLMTESEGAIRSQGVPWVLAAALNVHGRIALALRDPERAAKLSGEAAVIYGSLQDTWGMMHALVLLARAAALRSDSERAAVLLGAADSLIERSGASVYFADEPGIRQIEVAVLADAGLDSFKALRQKGRELIYDEVIALAESEGVSGPPT